MVKTSLYFSHLDVKPSYMVVCTVSVPQSHILNTLALGRKFIIICQGDFPPRQTEEQVISHTGISPQSDMEDLMILELPTNRPEGYKLRHCHVGKISVIFLFFYRKKVNAIHVWLVLISWHNKLAHNKISATSFALVFIPRQISERHPLHQPLTAFFMLFTRRWSRDYTFYDSLRMQHGNNPRPQ